MIRTDEQIKKDIVDQLYWDGRIDASDITITVDDGEVTLTGNVPSYRAREAAVNNAWRVQGVVGVENDLEIVYFEPETLPNDMQIRENILSSFRWNPDLRTEDIDVTVDKGWVTLEGTTDAFWKKMDAESIAYSVRGVVVVTNKIAIVTTQNITDELIAEDVMDAIERDVRVSVDSVDVTVTNGEVTLTGTVPSTTARNAAYSAALYTTGVINVDNNIIVREPALATA